MTIATAQVEHRPGKWQVSVKVSLNRPQQSPESSQVPKMSPEQIVFVLQISS